MDIPIERIAWIRQLKEETGAGLLLCKEAVTSTSTYLDAQAYLYGKLGSKIPESIRGRNGKEGIITSYIHNNKRVGVILELGCETDFVARMDVFEAIAHGLAMHITAMNPHSVEELLGQFHVKETKKTIEEILNTFSAQTKEKIEVRRFTRFLLGEMEVVH